jgi:peptidoglycan biosynthesis protein MviN/MurJ (putative lipid II flippase)
VPYRAVIQGWHDFYIVAGTAAATLVGLLFVGLSLHLRVVLARSEVRSLARVTLANLGLVLIVSLFMVIPEGRSITRTELLISGIVTLGLIAPSFLSATRSDTRTLRGYRLLIRIAFSAIAYAGVILASGFYTQRSYPSALSGLVAVVIALVVISLRNSWDLLVSVGEVTAHQDGVETD